LELYVRATSEAEKHSHLDEEYRNEFKKLSGGNSESVVLWKSFTRYSIDAMQNELSRLNVIQTLIYERVFTNDLIYQRWKIFQI